MSKSLFIEYLEDLMKELEISKELKEKINRFLISTQLTPEEAKVIKTLLQEIYNEGFDDGDENARETVNDWRDLEPSCDWHDLD